MADILAAVDISTVLTAVTAILVVVMAISLAFKGADLGKRAIRKV